MKKNRMVACLLICLLLLAGCTPAPGPTGTTVVPTTAPVSKAEIVIQQIPAKLENPDNLPVLKWVCMVDSIWGGGNRTWNEAAVIELNEMLAQRGAGYQVQFTMLTSPKMKYSEWFRRQEALDVLQDADLIYGLMTAEQMKEYLTPITAYIDGTKSTALAGLGIHNLSWVGGTIQGEIYGIPTRPAIIACGGWRVSPSVFSDLGLTEADFQKSYWEMEETFAKIYEANGNKAFLDRGVTGFSVSTPLSGQGAEGFMFNEFLPMLDTKIDFQGSVTALDYSSGSPKIVNYLETEAFRNVLAADREYSENGYFTSYAARVLVSYTACMIDRPYIDADGSYILPLGDSVYDTSPENCVTGVTASSKHHQEAVDLLALIAEDEEFRMQLFYGKEGRDYVIENGSYYLKGQEGNSNYSMDFLFEISYFSGLSSYDVPCYSSPSTLNYYYWHSYEGETVLDTQQTLSENCTVWCPVGFDYTGLEAELQAVQKIVEKKLPGVAAMSDGEYEQFIQELNDAGLDTVIAELQRQLDAWLAANPGWNK